MPKAFSEHERKRIKAEMMQNGSKLIRQKGIRQVRIDDIAKATNIAKGSFYSFYKSQEVFFYDVIRAEEAEILKQVYQILSLPDLDVKAKMRKVFREMFLQEDCIVYHLSDEDISYIIRKLPPEIMAIEENRGIGILGEIFTLLEYEVTPEAIDVVSAMTDSLRYIASTENFITEKGRQAMLNLMVNSYSDYVANGLGGLTQPLTDKGLN